MPTGDATAVPSVQAVRATVCEVQKAYSPAERRTRLVSITAHVTYNFEVGYILEDPRCMQGEDLGRLAGWMVMQFDRAKLGRNDPELEKLTSEWIASAIGKRVYCTCVGTVLYSIGERPDFIFDHAERVWATDDDLSAAENSPPSLESTAPTGGR